ncbi:MAG: hypothetical protein R6U65_07095, partial [Perlabentimonas sp.]
SFQVVSTLYKNGPDFIETILSDISAWMTEKGYSQISDFKGKMARKNVSDPFAYRRSQYVDILMRSDEYLNKERLP